MALWCTGARAQDRFEIQVYESEINDPLEPSLQLHINYTPAGRSTPDYPGEVRPDRSAHFTLEPALGLTEFLELGAYVQAVVAPGYGFKYGGAKLRLLGVVPRRISGAFDLGLNVELSWVPKAAEPSAWANELRPILGWRGRIVNVWLNPIVTWALSGEGALRPELEPAARLTFNTLMGFGVGAEYYMGLGAFADGFLPLSDQTHLVFATFDLMDRPGEKPSPWMVNFGVGLGLTGGTPQRVVIKAIVGRSL